MDWSRAKSLLIIAFLVLNLLLGYQLWMDELNLTIFSKQASQREELNRLLTSKDIRLACEIPAKTPALQEITVRFAKEQQALEEQQEMERLVSPLPVSILDNRKALEERLIDNIPVIKGYVPDPYAFRSEGVGLVMNQMYRDLPMFEARLEFFQEDAWVTGYRMSYAEVDTSASTDAPKILSAHTILVNLVEMYLPSGTVVSDVRLGYHGPIFESEKRVLAPYWRVVLSNGDTYYVHALNGAVEGPSSKYR
jgi:regulatory protein YycI of two-component signal transduction system YycFG